MQYTTKFNPGEIVWTIYENKVHSFRIARIEINIRPCYRNDGTLHPSPMMSEFLYEERHTQTLLFATTGMIVIRQRKSY